MNEKKCWKCGEIAKENNKRAASCRKNTRKEVRNSTCSACNSLAAFCWKPLLEARSGEDEHKSIFLNPIPNIDTHEPKFDNHKPKIDKYKPNIDNKKLQKNKANTPSKGTGEVEKC